LEKHKALAGLIHFRYSRLEQQRMEAINTDNIPRYEFHKIFQRLSYTVNLKGAFSAEEIDRRLERAISNFREAARATWREPEKKKLFQKAEAIETLKNKGDLPKPPSRKPMKTDTDSLL
jgi:hypothetical protein